MTDDGFLLGVDLTSDLHSHSDRTDGADTPAAMARAAKAHGLAVWGLSDHVRRDSSWVAEHVRDVRGLSEEGLMIRCGVEAKMLDAAGTLDIPNGLADLDYLLVADHQFPGDAGPVHPRDVRAALEAGGRRPGDVVDQLVAATSAAVVRSPFLPIVVHPFSLLPKLGVDEQYIGEDHLDALATACSRTQGAVEINEKWRCPSPRVVAGLLARGVPLVAGSDAHSAQAVGRHGYARDVLLGIAGSAADHSPTQVR